ncbi:MAG: hypothetical protein CL583_17815 [Alteromonadaceae bacterium]|nr:hypothetical protein [Alteromonadaceae bacterium]|tara:strand:- start:3708 stop:4421 length:714 start_codon:yes stop_codon:yes gene_type:complete
MSSAVVSNKLLASNFWIVSPCEWERSALTHFIESFGGTVSLSGELGDTWPSPNSYEKTAVILAAVGKHDAEHGALTKLFRTFSVEPIVLLIRNRLEDHIISELPSNVMAAIEASHPSTTMHSVLSLVASGHRILPSHAKPSSRLTTGDVRKVASAAQRKEILTRREKEVSREISLGKSNKDIARCLGISLNTVNAHTAAIRQKLGVHNRTQIALQMEHLVARPVTTPPSYARGSGPL